MAADAAITDLPALHAALDLAVVAARAGRIVTFGMKPTAPETGYGYIEAGAALPGAPGVQRDRPLRREAGCGQGGGFRRRRPASLEQRHVRRHRRDPGRRAGAPRAGGAAAASRLALAEATRDLDFVRLGAAAFAAAPAISIDYAVMEKTDRAAVVPADIGWTDLGSWAAMWEVAAKDAARQRRPGPGRDGRQPAAATCGRRAS